MNDPFADIPSQQPDMAQRFRPKGAAADPFATVPMGPDPFADIPTGPKINRFKPEAEADTVNKYFGNQATVGGALQNVWDAIKERYAAGGALSHEGAQELREGKPVSGAIASLLGRGEQALSPLTGAFDAASPYLPGLVGAGEGVPAEAPRAIPERPGEPMQLPWPRARKRLWSLQPVGAAAAPTSDVPAVPTKPIRRGIENVMRRLEGGEQASRMEFDKLTEALPAEAKTPEFGFKMRERDEDPSFPLTPEDEALRKQAYEPLKERERKNYETLHEADEEAPTSERPYTHRIRRGMGGIFERVREPFQESPIGPGRKQNLSKTPPSERARSFFVLEREGVPKDSNEPSRILVHQEGNKLLAWENGKETPIPYGEKPLKLGETTNILGKDYKLVDARASEIEQHARDSEGQPIEYERNGFVSTIHNIMQQEAAIRARTELKSVMQSPEGKAYFKFKIPNSNPPKGYRDISGVPALSKYWVPNKIADDIEYFFNTADRSEPDWYEKAWDKAARFSIGSIFWNPIPHPENIIVQYAMSRGEDWLKFWTPSRPYGGAYNSMARSLIKAIGEVKDQGPLYRESVARGSGQFYGRLMQQDFFPRLLKRFGEEIDRNPGLWRGLGLTGRAIMKVPHQVMWYVGDVLMNARIEELMETQKLSRDEAIKEAEQQIPPYKVSNTNALNKVMANSRILAFGRWHYDMIKSMLNAAQDVTWLGKTWTQRRQGLAKLAVLGAITSFVFPLEDEALQKLTGISGLRVARRGASKLVDVAGGIYGHYAPPGAPGKEWMKKWYGDRGFHDIIADSIMLNPMASKAIDYLRNLDWTGKHAIEPGQKTGLAAASTIASQLLQGGAEMVAPVADVIRMWQQGLSPKEELIKQTVGNTTPKKKYVEPKGQQKSEQRRAEQSDWIGHLMKWLHAPANR